MREIAEELATYFLIKDYKWKFNYGLANPDASDIDRAIDKILEILEEQEEDTQVELGHLMFKKRAGVVDIFVHASTIGEETK